MAELFNIGRNFHRNRKRTEGWVLIERISSIGPRHIKGIPKIEVAALY